MLSRENITFQIIVVFNTTIIFFKGNFFFFYKLNMWKGIKLVSLFDEQIVQVNILIDLPHKVRKVVEEKQENVD